MTTRRRLIQQASLTGLAFCSCGLLDAAHAHAHCCFRDAIDLMGDDAKSVLPPVKGVPERFITSDIGTRLRAMDAQRIDTLLHKPIDPQQLHDLVTAIATEA